MWPSPNKDRKLRLPAELAPVYEDYLTKYSINEIVFPYTPRFVEMLLAGVAKRANLQKKVTFFIRCNREEKERIMFADLGSHEHSMDNPVSVNRICQGTLSMSHKINFGKKREKTLDNVIQVYII